jgi:hypothetical protein
MGQALSPPGTEIIGEQTGGCDPIYIIVAEHGNGVASQESILDGGNRQIHFLHQIGVMQGGILSQKKISFLLAFDPSSAENMGS